MSAIDAPAAASGPSGLSTLSALYRLLLRTQITLARVLGIAALGVVSVLLGLFSRWDSNPAQAATDVTASYGLAVLVPLATLWLGTSALGDLVEDRLLVYLWLKPVPRWQLPVAAILATATVVVPLAAVPVAAAGAVAGESAVATRALLAAALAGLAYSGLFVAAGLWFRRAVWWGLAFVLVWENAIAHAAEGAARFTVNGWAGALLGTVPGVDVPVDAGSAAAALVILPAIGAVGAVAATWRYRRADVD